MMNLVLDQRRGLVRAPLPARPAAAANQEAVTQVAVQTLAVSQTLTLKNPRRRWSHQISQILMELR